MIKARMIYNNMGEDLLLVQKWGLSILVENQNESLLFDTGGDAEVLLQNIQSSGLDIQKISNIVISHNHQDHISGLPIILEHTEYKPTVYIPLTELENLKARFPFAKFVGVDQAVKINQNVWSTGQLQGMHRGNPIFEHGIILETESGVYLFTGCSHPGIITMVEQTKKLFPKLPIGLVAGGFHLGNHSNEQILDISDKLRRLGVDKIAPSHCTGDGAIKIFEDKWGADYVTFDLQSNELVI